MTRNAEQFAFEAPERYFLGPDDEFVVRPDCRHFKGGLPCKFWRPCSGCDEYSPVGRRYLLIMLGLFGDMLIASPLPPRIKLDHPDCHVTWLCDEAHVPLMEMNPGVDRVLAYSWETVRQLEREKFHAIYSFERTPGAAALMETVDAVERAGLAYGGPSSALYPVGRAAEHFFKMNTWNDHRTTLNSKTWTELYFEVAGYDYRGEPYRLNVPEPAREKARVDRRQFGTSNIIGFNLGSSLATKMWPTEHWIDLGHRLLSETAKDLGIWLFAGGKEHGMANEIAAALRVNAPGRVHYRPLPLPEFCAAIDMCDVVVTGDTFGYHLALLYEKPTVVLFGPSPVAEVVPKHAKRLQILTSKLACSPCAHQVACGGVGGCMGAISVTDVLSATTAQLDLCHP